MLGVPAQLKLLALQIPIVCPACIHVCRRAPYTNTILTKSRPGREPGRDNVASNDLRLSESEDRAEVHEVGLAGAVAIAIAQRAAAEVVAERNAPHVGADIRVIEFDVVIIRADRDRKGAGLPFGADAGGPGGVVARVK